MKEQFYDLSIDTLEDGTIRLEQRDYSGASVIIDAHPQHIIHIANRVKDCAPERIPTHPKWEAERIATLERRLSWVRDRFEECYEALPSDMYERCPEASGFYAWLKASVDVSNEYCADKVGVACDCISKPPPNPSAAPSPSMGDDRCPPSVAGCDSEHFEQRHEDLFSDKAGRKQHGND